MISLRLLLATTLVLGSTATLADTCQVKAAGLARLAHPKGYGFDARAEGDASCTLSSHKAGGSAAAATNGSCVFDLFTGQQLRAPWVFDGLTAIGHHFRVERQPARGGRSLHTRVVLAPPGGGTARFLLTSITLSGGDCADWADAL